MASFHDAQGRGSAPAPRLGTVLHARKARADGYGSTRQKPMEDVAGLEEHGTLGAQPEEVAGYGGQGVQELSAREGQEKARAPAPGLGPEMFACQTMEELFDVIMEEAGSMSGGNATVALKRMVQLSRGRAHRVSGAPALSALAAVLDAQAADLTPKVGSPPPLC